MIKLSRITSLNSCRHSAGPVVYLMSRDQRVNDNWALIFAQQLADDRNMPLVVAFCLSKNFLNAAFRQYAFMLKGLKIVESKLRELNISFYLLYGSSDESLIPFLNRIGAGAVVTDFDPLKIKTEWRTKLAKSLDIPLYEVDAHNIVPCRIVSNKQEYGAYTLRPKINRLLDEYLDEYPTVHRAIGGLGVSLEPFDLVHALNWIEPDRSVNEVDWIEPGEPAAMTAFHNFIENKLPSYPETRNDPTKNGQSGLSPYLHFGHLSAQRIVMDIKKLGLDADEFLEELIVRRELADNFCFYNKNYDNFDGFPDWAKKTLREHQNDIREDIYTRDELENGFTHDDLWNAAQREMVVKGKMHGYMRMYWAKKILEWSPDPGIAMDHAIYLNDKYELDGRDPNGYAGIAWSIGGVHDRAWGERAIFGKIRYMSYNGCKSKFDIKKYIADNK